MPSAEPEISATPRRLARPARSSFRRVSLIVCRRCRLARSTLSPPRLVPGRTQGRTRSRPALPDRAVSGVEGLAALGVCVVLGRLATVVFPVVAYDPYSPDPCLVIRRGSVLVGLRCSGVLPGYEQNQVAGREHGVEDVPGRHVGGPRVQAEPLGAVVRVVGLLPPREASRVDQRDRRCLPDFGLLEPLLRQG